MAGRVFGLQCVFACVALLTVSVALSLGSVSADSSASSNDGFSAACNGTSVTTDAVGVILAESAQCDSAYAVAAYNNTIWAVCDNQVYKIDQLGALELVLADDWYPYCEAQDLTVDATNGDIYVACAYYGVARIQQGTPSIIQFVIEENVCESYAVTFDSKARTLYTTCDTSSGPTVLARHMDGGIVTLANATDCCYAYAIAYSPNTGELFVGCEGQCTKVITDTANQRLRAKARAKANNKAHSHSDAEDENNERVSLKARAKEAKAKQRSDESSGPARQHSRRLRKDHSVSKKKQSMQAVAGANRKAPQSAQQKQRRHSTASHLQSASPSHSRSRSRSVWRAPSHSDSRSRSRSGSSRAAAGPFSALRAADSHTASAPSKVRASAEERSIVSIQTTGGVGNISTVQMAGACSNPASIAVNPKTNELIVGCNGNDASNVIAFQHASNSFRPLASYSECDYIEMPHSIVADSNGVVYVACEDNSDYGYGGVNAIYNGVVTTLVDYEQCEYPYSLWKDEATGMLYAACEESGILQIATATHSQTAQTATFNVSNVVSPIGGTVNCSNPNDIIVVNGAQFMACGDAGVYQFTSTAAYKLTTAGQEGGPFTTNQCWYAYSFAVSADGSKLFVSCEASVLAINLKNPTAAGAVTTLLNVTLCGDIYDIEANPSNALLYLACQQPYNVFSINTTNGMSAKLFATDGYCNYPYALDINTATNQLVVSCQYSSDFTIGTVLALNLNDNVAWGNANATISIIADDYECEESSGIVVDSARNTVYAVCYDNDDSSIMALAGSADRQAINYQYCAGGSNVNTLALDAVSGTVFAACNNWGDVGGGELVAFNGQSSAFLLSKYPCQTTSTIYYSSSGNTVYVGCQNGITSVAATTTLTNAMAYTVTATMPKVDLPYANCSDPHVVLTYNSVTYSACGSAGVFAIPNSPSAAHPISQIVSNADCDFANGLAVNPQTDNLYVVCSGSGVLVVSLGAVMLSPGLAANTTFCPTPTAALVDSSTNTLYVSCANHIISIPESAAPAQAYIIANSAQCATPFGLSLDSATHTLYAACYGATDGSQSTPSVISISSTGTVRTVVDSTVCRAPTSVAFSAANGGTLYFNCAYNDNVMTLAAALTQNVIVPVVPEQYCEAYYARTSALYFDANTGGLFVACSSDSDFGSLTVLAVYGGVANSVLSQPYCAQPSSVFFDSNSSRLHVGCPDALGGVLSTTIAVKSSQQFSILGYTAVNVVVEANYYQYQCDNAYDVISAGNGVLYAACGDQGVYRIVKGAPNPYQLVPQSMYCYAYDMELDAARNRLYVACDSSAGNVQALVIAADAQDSTHAQPLVNSPQCEYAYAVSHNPTTGDAYVSCYNTQNVLKVPLSGNVSTVTNSTICSYPLTVLYNPLTNSVLVGCYSSDWEMPTIISVSVASGVVTTMSGVYSCYEPYALALGPSGDIFAACYDNDDSYLYLLSGNTFTSLQTYPQCYEPYAPGSLYFDAVHNVLFVACYYGYDEGYGGVVAVSSDGTVSSSLADYLQCEYPTGVALDPTGTVLYASCDDTGVIAMAVNYETTSPAAFVIESTLPKTIVGPGSCESIYDATFSAGWLYVACGDYGAYAIPMAGDGAATPRQLVSSTNCSNAYGIAVDSIHHVAYIACEYTAVAVQLTGQRRVFTVADLSSCQWMYATAVDPNSGRGYFSCESGSDTDASVIGVSVSPSGTVSVTVWATQQICNYPNGLAVDPRNGNVIATCEDSYYGNIIRLYAPKQFSLVTNEYGCYEPYSVAVDPQSGTIWASCWDNNENPLVAITGASSFSIPASYYQCGYNDYYHSLAVSASGIAFAACYQESSYDGNGVVVAIKDGVVASVLNYEQCAYPSSVTFDDATNTVYAVCEDYGYVAATQVSVVPVPLGPMVRTSSAGAGSPMPASTVTPAPPAAGPVNILPEEYCSEAYAVAAYNGIAYGACYDSGVVSVPLNGNISAINVLVDGDMCEYAYSVALDTTRGVLYAACYYSVVSVNLTDNSVTVLAEETQCDGAQAVTVDSNSGIAVASCYYSDGSYYPSVLAFQNGVVTGLVNEAQCYYPYGVAIDPNTGTVFATCTDNEWPYYTVIAILPSGVVLPIANEYMCDYPYSVAINALTGSLYVGCEDNDELYLMQINGNAYTPLTKDYYQCDEVYGTNAIFVDQHSGVVYVACYDGSSNGEGAIIAISNNVVIGVMNWQQCQYPYGVSYDPVTKKLAAACENNGLVAIDIQLDYSCANPGAYPPFTQFPTTTTTTTTTTKKATTTTTTTTASTTTATTTTTKPTTTTTSTSGSTTTTTITTTTSVSSSAAVVALSMALNASQFNNASQVQNYVQTTFLQLLAQQLGVDPSRLQLAVTGIQFPSSTGNANAIANGVMHSHRSGIRAIGASASGSAASPSFSQQASSSSSGQVVFTVSITITASASSTAASSSSVANSLTAAANNPSSPLNQQLAQATGGSVSGAAITVVPTATSPPSSNSNDGAVAAAAVLGAVLGVLLLAGLGYYFLVVRKRGGYEDTPTTSNARNQRTASTEI